MGLSVIDVAHVNKDGYLGVLNTDDGQRTGIGVCGPSGFDYKSMECRGPWGAQENVPLI